MKETLQWCHNLEVNAVANAEGDSALTMTVEEIRDF